MLPKAVVWDCAETVFPCSRCKQPVIEGEAYRVSKVPGHAGICEPCSIELDDTPAPVNMPVRTFLERLRDQVTLRPTKPESSVPEQLRLAPPQPAADPRGQGRHRHGIADAMRDSINNHQDYRRRRSGERTE